MGGTDNETADGAADTPLTVELLADLQAGLLDDDSAARLRKRVREDPEAEKIMRALNQVRCDVATLGVDAASAPDAPPEVTARISAALRSADQTAVAHSARPRLGAARVVAGVAGVGAVLAAVGVGTVALIRAPEPAPSVPASAAPPRRKARR